MCQITTCPCQFVKYTNQNSKCCPQDWRCKHVRWGRYAGAAGPARSPYAHLGAMDLDSLVVTYLAEHRTWLLDRAALATMFIGTNLNGRGGPDRRRHLGRFLRRLPGCALADRRPCGLVAGWRNRIRSRMDRWPTTAARRKLNPPSETSTFACGTANGGVLTPPEAPTIRLGWSVQVTLTQAHRRISIAAEWRV